MFSVTQPLRVLKCNGEHMKRQTALRCNNAVRAAARAFAEVLLEEIPVYTGECIGSVIPLAEALGLDTGITGPYVTSTKTARGELQGNFHLPNRNSRVNFRFMFDSAVDYYPVNDLTDAKAIYKWLKKPTPWHTMAHANRAFENALEDDFARRKLRVRMDANLIIDAEADDPAWNEDDVYE